MVHKGGILGPSIQGAEMLESEAIRGLFTLRRLGWGIKRITRELGIARNTVRDWLRDGVGRQYSGSVRSPLLTEHLPLLRERFLAGVRNGDVLRQELAARGVVASLRTVNRALKPLRQDLVMASRATIRFETPPGSQMQVDFGEKWLEIGGVQQKRYVFVAMLGFSRRTFAMVFGSMRQRDWIAGLEGAFHHFGGVPQEVLTDNARPWSSASRAGKRSSTLSLLPSAITGVSAPGPASPTGHESKARSRTGWAMSKATPWAALPLMMTPTSIVTWSNGWQMSPTSAHMGPHMSALLTGSPGPSKWL